LNGFSATALSRDTTVIKRVIDSARRNAGFTLAEVLVTLALIALLGAALLPVVAGQILKGDAGRVTEDLRSVQLGVEQFLGDIHRYAGKYSDLSKVITTANADINAVAYTTGLVAKWAGPYVAKDTVNASVPTGYGGSINNVFMKVANTNGVNYVTIVITGISGVDFDRIDLQFDGVVNRTGGLLRWVSAGGIDSTKFLGTPIQ
jgi:prepilin-type N-terminal cleavage/methylation domain-containing protein